jgi:hypothetical protein
MNKVIRLPTQHKNYPHCPSCSRDITSLDDLQMILAESSTKTKVLAVTVEVQCECGQILGLRKSVSRVVDI